MAISISYTPMQAVLDSATLAGQGQARQQALDNDYRNRHLQQQWDQGSRQLAAGMFEQQQQLAANANYQAFHAQQQQQLQQQQLRQQDLQNKYGFYAKAMGDITDLEAKGFQYTPEQQATLKGYDADIHHVTTDEAINPMQKQQALQEILSKRAMIRPSAPPPKPRQQVFEESLVRHRFDDGTEVVGTMGERSGMPHFDPIENPAKKDAVVEQKAQFEREKFSQQMELGQHKLQQASDALELNRLKSQMDLQSKQDQAEQKLLQSHVDTVTKAYQKMRDAQVKALTTPQKIGVDGKPSGPDRAELARQYEETFKTTHGKMAMKFAPDIAEALDLQPAQEPSSGGQAGSGQDESAFFGWQDAPFQQSGEPPAITQPEVVANLPTGYRYKGADGQVHAAGAEGPSQQPGQPGPAFGSYEEFDANVQKFSNAENAAKWNKKPPEQKAKEYRNAVSAQPDRWGPAAGKPAAQSAPEQKQRDAMIDYMKALPEAKSQEEADNMPKGKPFIMGGKIYVID